jgi:hypothetical protein
LNDESWSQNIKGSRPSEEYSKGKNSRKKADGNDKEVQIGESLVLSPIQIGRKEGHFHFENNLEQPQPLEEHPFREI